jgi:hypothetical protein
MRSALLLFIDGEGHQAGLYTGTSAGCQVPADRQQKTESSARTQQRWATRLRLSSADLDKALPFTSCCWRKAQTTSADIGWVLVSRRWDTGAHM